MATKFRAEEIAFVLKNYSTLSEKDMMHELGFSVRAINNLLLRLKSAGLIAIRKPHVHSLISDYPFIPKQENMMARKNFNRKVLERFMTAEQIAQLESTYQANKRRVYAKKLSFTAADWEMFKTIKDIAEGVKHFGKRKETVLRRLGQMVINSHQ